MEAEGISVKKESRVFFRSAWRKEEHPAEGVINRLRESKGKVLIALTTSIDSVRQMTGLARRAREDGAAACVIFGSQCHFTEEDFQEIEESAIDALFLTSIPNYGTPFRCSKVVCLTGPKIVRGIYEKPPIFYAPDRSD